MYMTSARVHRRLCAQCMLPSGLVGVYSTLRFPNGIAIAINV